MTISPAPRSRSILSVAIVALAAGGLGYALGHVPAPRANRQAPVTAVAAKPLYYYDPMVPAQHFDKPGKSPFMDMQLMPRYPDDAGAAGALAGVKIDAAAMQNLGVRLATVERGSFAQSLDAPGVIDFNQRNLAIVQSRAAGFVQRTYAHAPGDLVRAGAPIADLLIPSWASAQTEYLAVRHTGDASLAAAARQRLHLLGMSAGLIAEVARTGSPRGVVTISTPVGGAIQTLDVRQGMTVAMGQALAQVSGLGSVWLNASVPETLSGQVRVGQLARAELSAFPGESFSGRVSAILPTAQADSRSLQVRVELPNPGGRLRPGLFATVHLNSDARSALFVPSEAVIRTGKRTLVMLAGEGGRYQPIEIQVGGENVGRTEVLAGLSEGQKVVASGQFLIDSEASLTGIQVRPLSAEPVMQARHAQ